MKAYLATIAKNCTYNKLKQNKQYIEYDDQILNEQGYKEDEFNRMLIIEEKIKQLNELKKEVSRFKQKTIAMRNFENDEWPEIPTYESIDKTLPFISQKGDESLAEIVKNKDLILITKYNEEGALIVDSSLIGFEIFEDESFDIEKYKNYMKYHLKGRYMTFSRKGTVGNMIDFINAAMSKYGIEDEVLPIIECTFNMVRLDESTIHFAKIYIPIHE